MPVGYKNNDSWTDFCYTIPIPIWGDPTLPHPIEPSTLRILTPDGKTVGTGFLVAKNLAVTCAHVIKDLNCGAGDTVYVCFTGKATSTAARVLPEYWCPDEATDIAILQVDEIPAGVFPLRMGRASESKLKNDLYTFGYAIAANEQGIGGLGTFITLKQEGNFIQFRMHEADHGHSGAPIYDDKRGVVVGMIKKGHTHLGRNAKPPSPSHPKPSGRSARNSNPRLPSCRGATPSSKASTCCPTTTTSASKIS